MQDEDRDIRLRGQQQSEQTLIALALLMGGVCLYQALVRGGLVWALGLVPSAALFVAAVVALRDKRPRLVIGRDGVEDRSFGVGQMPWSAIAALEDTAVRQSRFLRLRLHDPAQWRARMSVWRRLAMDARSMFGVAPFSIDAQSYRVDPDALFLAIRRRWQAAQEPGPDARPEDPAGPDPRTALH